MMHMRPVAADTAGAVGELRIFWMLRAVWSVSETCYNPSGMHSRH